MPSIKVDVVFGTFGVFEFSICSVTLSCEPLFRQPMMPKRQWFQTVPDGKESVENIPLVQVEAMFALTDFTIANGATQVVPGSHHWPLEREAEPDEVIQAEMKAGSALFYLGSTIHGGGANTTTDEYRRGMFLGFVVGWLRTEENMFLTVPIEKARTMPLRAQELLGYKAHMGIGVVDVGSPMVLLNE